jgi:CheY-specific phosphatase CheX
MSSDITAALIQATTATVESMCFTAVMDDASARSADLTIGAEVAFSGDATGCIRVDLSADAATSIAAGFLGIEQEEVEETAARTVLLELANMICGCMLSLHNPTGSFVIGIPTVSDPLHVLDADATCALELETGVIRVRFAGEAGSSTEVRL